MEEQQQQPKEPKLTPASEFRKMRERGVALTLYTGRNIRMRGVDPSHFVKELDGAPNMFSELILKMFWDGKYQELIDEFLKRRENPKETAELAASLGVVAKKVLLMPRVVDVPQTDDEDEEIAISDLGINELVWIFRLAFQPHAVLYYLEANGLDSGTQDTEQAGSPLGPEGTRVTAAEEA
jgi:hypothetical protein